MNMVLQSAQMSGCDRNEVNGAISIIETVIAHCHNKEKHRKTMCFVDQLFFDNNHLEINLNCRFDVKVNFQKYRYVNHTKIINENFITNDRGN
jgi:hypothetical protein